MDLLWRVVTSILISGRSHNVRCAFDPEHDRLIIHDSSACLEKRRILGWAKLGRSFVSPETRERQDAAITNRDIYSLRRDAGAAVHRACERIRIISQEADSPRSVHVLWSSKVFTSGDRVAITYGPRTGYQQGMTMVVKVSAAITPWMKHLKHFFPFIEEDPSLWANTNVYSRNITTAQHAQHTPVRENMMMMDEHGEVVITSPQATVFTPLHHNQPHNFATNIFSSSSASLTTSIHNNSSKPSAAASIGITTTVSSSSASCSNDHAHQQSQQQFLAEPCCACNRRLPPSLVIFVESCNHIVCVECATACARYYAEVALATTYQCPCPAARCNASLRPHELRPLLPSHEWDNLEVNEMRIAVDQGITCPKCKMVFDGVKVNTVNNDPLENRFKCSMCETTFCVSCGAHPFHEGKPCRDATQKGQPTCRYCLNPAVSLLPTICADLACAKKASRSCNVSKPCGHLCHGTKGESECCSCLEPGCSVRSSAMSMSDLTKDDLCSICYVETLGEAPCLELACGHVFHTHCLEARLEHKWPTAAVSYRFLDCPLCTRPIAHQLLAATITPLQKARDALEARYIERLRIEGLLDHPAITSIDSPYYNAPVSWARQNLTYFECFECKKPYFGGIRGCYANNVIGIDDHNNNNNNDDHGNNANNDNDMMLAALNDPEIENPPREQLVCGGCALAAINKNNGGGGGSSSSVSAEDGGCKEHGAMFLEYKCKYCCNLAVWFCWGTTHFCDACHNPPRKTVRMECPGEELCPIQGRHPPNGTEFLLGCAVCDAKNKNNGAKRGNRMLIMQGRQ